MKTFLFSLLAAGCTLVSTGDGAHADNLQSTLSPASDRWPRVWTTYSTVRSIDADFADLKAHGVDAVMLRAPSVREAKAYLEAARKHGLRLGVRLGKHLLPNAEMVEDAGLKPQRAVMIGGVYRGKAIDRFLFAFSAGKHEILIEPPVYNQRFAYKGRVSGEPAAHYFPEIGDPLRAEIVVPLAAYDGRQHLKILPATVERASDEVTLAEDSVSDRMPPSRETRDRNLYRLRFDLTGMQSARLDRVGVAVYWKYRGSREWYILNWSPVSMAADSTREAVRRQVRKRLAVWSEANGGTFPEADLVALRFGDETFYLTGHLGGRTPSVNYPLWDYSPSAVRRFRERAGDGVAYPRTWGHPEIYGPRAYSAWMYTLHEACADVCGAARAEAGTVSRTIMVFRNTTRFDVFSLANDHDGSGPELLTRNLDLVHIDPYPVGRSGYKNNIPRDMSYYGGLARRYGKPLVPWMQAHSYVGLDHVAPGQIDRMAEGQWNQGVDAVMWLGYGNGATFPRVNPESWERAAAFHRRLHRELPPKPKARLAVLRSYDAWALTNIEENTVRNPDDWLLQQWLEVWSVDHGRPYDVFELPPGEAAETAGKVESILERYPHGIANVPAEGAWYVGEGIDARVLPLDLAERHRRRFEREMEAKGWLGR